MIGYVLTRIDAAGSLTTQLFRDQWSAIAAAEKESGSPLVWSPPPGDDSAHWEAGDYLLDELVMEPRAHGAKASKITLDVEPGEYAESVQFLANGVALGEPDRAAPYRKTWSRPAGQAEAVELQVKVVYADGRSYQGTVISVD